MVNGDNRNFEMIGTYDFHGLVTQVGLENFAVTSPGPRTGTVPID